MSRLHVVDLGGITDLLVSALEALEAELMWKGDAAVGGPLWREVDERMGRLERAKASAQDDVLPEAELL